MMANIYPDWFFLPSSATMRFPFAVTNQSGNVVYVKTILSGQNGGNLPSGWTDTPKQHGALNHGSTLYGYHEASRTIPTFTAGVYDEVLELRIQFFSDSTYTTLVLTLVEQLNVSNYKSDDAAWMLYDSDDFEVDVEGWGLSSSIPWYTEIFPTRYSGEGYASTYAIGYVFSSQNAGSLQVLVGDGSLIEGQAYSEETVMVLDVKGLGIADVWHVFGGKHTLAGTNVGVAIKFVEANNIYAVFKKFPKPNVAELRVSGVVRFDSADSRWYVDKVRWVNK